VLCIELGLNMLYQRADVGASGPKFIEGETAVVSEFISSSVEDHVAVESVEGSVCCRKERIEQAAASSRKPPTYTLQSA